MKKTICALVLTGVAVPFLASGAADLSKLPPASTKSGVTYAADIKPLFEASCVRCHGADKPKAGLRLDSLESVLKGGKEGKVVIPNQSDKSKLVIAVARLDKESAMPPEPRQGRGRGGPAANPVPGSAGAGAPRREGGAAPKPLTAEQVGLIRAWIDQGAK